MLDTNKHKNDDEGALRKFLLDTGLVDAYQGLHNGMQGNVILDGSGWMIPTGVFLFCFDGNRSDGLCIVLARVD